MRTSSDAPPGTTGVPVGTVIQWIGTTDSLASLAQSGWLSCDGSWAVQSTDGLALYGVIGDTFGAFSCDKLGEMFRLPDLRGMFLRGLAANATQDPDIGARQGLPFVGPAGYDGFQQGQLPSGRAVGTYEEDDFAKHNHAIPDQYRGDSGVITCDNLSSTCVAYTSDESNWGISIGNLQPAGGSTETRPRNVYVYFLIYAGNPVQTYPAGTPS
ncbi:MAG TPA: phage tail protein [Steroidobacteraceae bacterium]|nr:phage tail protein [Steroidobacteraceae bacterium]